ncbi:MAG TPA: glycosyltransferase family 9 protein [Gemmatimonadaceae bacterium]
MRVLLSRTDRIGDVVLTLPLCSLLKTQLGAEVVMLARAYTRPVLEASPYVDEILEWDRVEGAGSEAQRALLASARADAVLHVFPRAPIARAARAARIPRRIGTSHRWYHWFTCNDLEHFSRKHSDLHEAQLDIRLARPLLGDAIPTLASLANATRLTPRVPLPPAIERVLDSSRTVVAMHPGSGGSAREWPLDYWTALTESLESSRVQLLVTGSAEERERLQPWLARLSRHVVDLTGQLSLAELIALYARIDGVVAASTGPLHVAAGAGAHALGLFPPTPPIHPGRWAPVGPRAEWLTAPAVCATHAGGSATCECMRAIPVDSVRERVLAWTAARRSG